MSDDLLERLAADPRRAAILLDVDGTLAPIVERHEDARIPDETRAELARLASRYALVACVSGRPGEDVDRMLGVAGVAIVPTAAVGVLRQRAQGVLSVRAALVVGLASILGVEIGVRVATGVDEDVLRRGFGVLLVAVAAQLAIRGFRHGRRYPEAS